MGVRYSRDGFEARAEGVRISSLAELAVTMPVQAIDPEVHRLVEEGPQERRRYLDWGVFHVEPRFVDQWRRYQRALKQRNAALRASPAGICGAGLGSELIDSGDAHRSISASSISATCGRTLLPSASGCLETPVELWTWLTVGRAGSSFADALGASWKRDAERGTTHVGPHRADVGNSGPWRAWRATACREGSRN